MKKRAFLLFAVVGLMAAQIVSCGEPTPPTPPSDDTENTEQPNEKPENTNVNKKDIKITVPVKDNWIFDGKPSFDITIENLNDVEMESTVKIKIITDTQKPVTTIEQKVTTPAGEKTFTITTDKKMNYYPEMTHDYPSSWSSDISKWFKNHTK